MPTVTIDGRTVEVEQGTNLVDAAARAGVEIPHYCYHPRLSVVGQCRMCLVKIEGMPKLQTGCTTQVMKDGMVVLVDDDEVRAAQEGIMEFLLINHPLDCPICDQAGECGLQDYSFKHGQAFSRFEYAEKRTYPGKERIPLGSEVVLNMNRCIQCTRCVRFTEEITGTGELGLFQRGARAEIGVFPGKELSNDLSTCVVDICPVGALTSTRFRFAERVWNLEKVPSICTGCDAGCNITVEHRRGSVRRYKPRANPAVNDYWMCDFGRGGYRRLSEPRLSVPTLLRNGRVEAVSWRQALDATCEQLRSVEADEAAILASGCVSNEEAFLLSRLSAAIGTSNRSVLKEPGRARSIPNPAGGVSGSESTPNRRGAELAGLFPGDQMMRADDLVERDAASQCRALLVADGDPGSRLHESEVVARLRRAEFLIVIGWAETPLTAVADIVLPAATPVEKDGTYVNSQYRLQRAKRAFPAPTGVRTGTSILCDLLGRFQEDWIGLSEAQVFERMATEFTAFSSVGFDGLPAGGVILSKPAGTAREA